MSPVSRILLCIACLLPLTAIALPDDREQPIHIEADKLEIDETRHISIYQGNVVMRQGSLNLQADRIVFHFDQDNNLEWLDISGSPASFRQLNEQQQTLSGSAKAMQYYDQKGLMEMTGDARYQSHKDSIESESITVNMKTDALKAGSGEGNGRVRMLIQPKTNSKQP